MRSNGYDDDEPRYTVQRCPVCRRTFRVPPGEAGEHECPHCGCAPYDEAGPEEEDDDHDPHCTCPDCVQAHIDALEDDDHTEHDETPHPDRLGRMED